MQIHDRVAKNIRVKDSQIFSSFWLFYNYSRFMSTLLKLPFQSPINLCYWFIACFQAWSHLKFCPATLKHHLFPVQEKQNGRSPSRCLFRSFSNDSSVWGFGVDDWPTNYLKISCQNFGLCIELKPMPWMTHELVIWKWAKLGSLVLSSQFFWKVSPSRYPSLLFQRAVGGKIQSH